MAYGVMFHVEKDYPNSSRKFKALLREINAEKYVWKIDESDFYNLASLENILDRNRILYGEDVLKELDCEVMMIWIALEGYRNEYDITDLGGSFKNFLESKCETAVFVVDTCMFAVYTKNEETLNKAVEFAKNNNTGTLEIIEDEHADWYFGV